MLKRVHSTVMIVPKNWNACMYLGALGLSFDTIKIVVLRKYTLGNQTLLQSMILMVFFLWQPEHHYNNLSAAENKEYLGNQAAYYFVKGGRSIQITSQK